MDARVSMEFADKVEALTRRRIEIFDGAGDDWRFAESLKSISEDTAQEYEGRALVELVQNGHDALKLGPGRIAIVLDLKHAPGVLYVANEGLPFSQKNFRAITEFALSDKGAGEGIGNKGLGFRSVLQLTDWPEVYSKARPDSQTFDGYCFRFARPADIEALIGPGDLADRVVSQVSPLALPVPAPPRDPLLTAFAHDGFSTVVRLPLRGQSAADAALQQLKALRSVDAPLLLFLDRVQDLTAELRGEDGLTIKLTRTEGRCELVADGAGWLSEVDLDECGRYLLARRPLNPDSLAEAIAASVAAREVDEKWKEWDCQGAWVGLALRLDEPLKAGRLYTFLPMSEGARSPLAAHAHAPFFTKLARLSLSETVPLNDHLLRELAHLSVRLLRTLREGAPREAAVGLVPDLACWSPHARLDGALDGALASEAIVPLLGSGGWGTLHQSFDWAEESRPWQEITGPVLAALGVHIMDTEAAGVARRARLLALHEAVTGLVMRPSGDTIAQWCETVAGALPAPNVSDDALGRWAAYYDDLHLAFASDSSPLRGRRVVVDSAGTLRAALGGVEPREDTVFFSPEQSGPDAPARVPSRLRALRSRIAFTHPDIPWNRTARAFLESSGLVREYRTDRVFDALRDLLARTKSDALRRDALEFAFLQFPSLNSAQRGSLAAVRFFIPRADGAWARAGESLLSPEWDADGARLLQRCLAAGGDAVKALGRQRDRWITPPGSWPHPIDDTEAYRTFLDAVGVRDGLAPIVLPAVSERPGHTLTPSSLAGVLRVPPELVPGWSADIATRWNGGNHPYTYYGFAQQLRTLPGAAESITLGPAARREYAELIVHGLKDWPETMFAVTVWRRNRPVAQQDRHSWPTPLSSALRHLPWLPVSEEDGLLGFRRPDEAWYQPDGELPPFVSAMPRTLRLLLAADPRVLKRAEGLGLRRWDDPRHAAAAVRELAAALEDGVVPDHLSAGYKKEYARALAQAATAHTWPWAGVAEGPVLAVERDGRLEPLRPLPEQALYLPDVHDPLKQSLVELAGHPVLVSDPEAGEATGALLRTRGLRVIVLSEIDVKVFSAGEQVLPASSRPLLVDDREWLIAVVAAVLELKGGTFLRRRTERTLRSLLSRLRAVRIARVADVEVGVGGATAVPPAGVRSLPLADAIAPTIVVWGTDGYWDELQACAPSLAYLLSQSYLHDALELALIKLQRHFDGTAPHSLDDEVLARVLDTTAARVREVRRAVAGGLDAVKSRLRPLVAYAAGPSRARPAALAVDDCQTEEAVDALVVDLAPKIGAIPADLMALLRQADALDELRDALRLDFVEFNQALAVLGAPYAPLTHPELHEAALDRYVEEVAGSIQNRLRERYRRDAVAGRPLDGYLAGRRFEGLDPNPAWLPLCRVPSEDQMRAQVQDWLRGHDADTDLDAPPALSPSGGMRAQAAARLEEVVASAVPLVRGWSFTKGVQVPPAWNQTPLVEAVFALENSGLAELIDLDDQRLLAVAASGAGWPAGMPLTRDMAALGLTEADLRAARVAAGNGPRPTPARATIRLGTDELPVGTGNLERIAEAALRTIDPAFLTQHGRTALAELPATPPRGGGSAARGRSVVARNVGLSEDQRTAVGLIGEVAARAWLGQRYRDVRWKSGYAAIVSGDPDASDGYGYDFEAAWRNTTLMFEVKALVAEPGALTEFELGESEVRAAQAAARGDRYRILLVTQALDPAERKIHQLPNPFSARGQGRFRVTGRGLRYQCAPT